MPVGDADSGIPGGQKVTFAIDADANASWHGWRWIRAKKFKPFRGHQVLDTCTKIAHRNGHPEMAETIARANHIHSHKQKTRRTQDGHPVKQTIPAVNWGLEPGRLLRIPALLRPENTVSVFCDDPPPVIKDGYATFDVIDVPGRRGISRFKGYNPIVFDIPIQFEAWLAEDAASASLAIEQGIQKIEKMAGRGQFKGAGVGPPSIIRVSVTDNDGNILPLLPSNYQWSRANPHAPVWRITGVAWDANPLRVGARRGRINSDRPDSHPARGRRLRQKATVTLTEYTGIHIVERSATKRSKKRHKRTEDRTETF